ncbi:hypothetical protein AGMMS49942_14790 [Spirochaetia bacterium]|nr:hypothetical protein AGMMS49942_14790 [Spirochaetia bacterium]
MDISADIKIFDAKKVRTLWNEDEEEWYFSIVDVAAVLTDSVDPAAYWRKLKQRLKEEGNETVTNCHALKLLAPDGKMRLTDVTNTQQLFRLIQSIPSPKAEPFKQWIAQVAKERLDQAQDPELSIEQAMLVAQWCPVPFSWERKSDRRQICLVPGVHGEEKIFLRESVVRLTYRHNGCIIATGGHHEQHRLYP